MTGYDIIKKASIRLGYDNCSQTFNQRGLEYINQICSELKINNIISLSQNVTQDLEQVEVICCGVAMLISFVEGDTEKNKVYTNLYNAKRTALLSKINIIEDVLNKGGEL